MTQKATFAMGCFWAPQEFFSKLKGIVSTKVGYTGGSDKTSYEQVCSGSTKHSEAIEIEFDEKIINYKELLKHFWKQHDPIPHHKQQYASILFVHNDKQKNEAKESKLEIEKKLGSKVSTKIQNATKFYEAEEYHQNYLKKRKGKSFLKRIFS